MKIKILKEAERDIEEGFFFYEKQSPGLGDYFLDSIFSDIDSLIYYYGIHRKVFNYHRLLSKRFPFSIYYSVESNAILVSNSKNAE